MYRIQIVLNLFLFSMELESKSVCLTYLETTSLLDATATVNTFIAFIAFYSVSPPTIVRLQKQAGDVKCLHVY